MGTGGWGTIFFPCSVVLWLLYLCLRSCSSNCMVERNCQNRKTMCEHLTRWEQTIGPRFCSFFFFFFFTLWIFPPFFKFSYVLFLCLDILVLWWWWCFHRVQPLEYLGTRPRLGYFHFFFITFFYLVLTFLSFSLFPLFSLDSSLQVFFFFFFSPCINKVGALSSLVCCLVWLLLLFNPLRLCGPMCSWLFVLFRTTHRSFFCLVLLSQPLHP